MIVSLVTIFSRRLEGSLRCSQLVSRRTKLRGRAVRTLPTYWIIQIRRVVRVLRVSRWKMDYNVQRIGGNDQRNWDKCLATPDSALTTLHWNIGMSPRFCNVDGNHFIFLRLKNVRKQNAHNWKKKMKVILWAGKNANYFFAMIREVLFSGLPIRTQINNALRKIRIYIRTVSWRFAFVSLSKTWSHFQLRDSFATSRRQNWSILVESGNWSGAIAGSKISIVNSHATNWSLCGHRLDFLFFFL